MRRDIAGAASGLRRADSALRRAEALADGFQGLPEGVSRWRLAAALRAAARRLDLTAPMLTLLEHYIDLSWDADWEAGAEPVITRPLSETADWLGRSERQIRNLERALAERGLLAWRDSGNHHRKGRRGRDGRLVWAYGPSLAPLAARAGEVIRLAAEARAEAAAIRRTRIAISALRRRVAADLAVSGDKGLAARFAARPRRFPAGVTLAALTAERDALADLAETARAAAGDDAEISGKPETGGRHRTDTAPESAMNGRSREDEAPGGARRAEARAPAFDAKAAAGLERVPLALALRAAGPRLAFLAEAQGPPSWASLAAAARALAPDLGLPPALWDEAASVLGLNGAALCVLVVERGLDRGRGGAPPVANPGGYLRALAARARDGTLALDRSVFALAEAGGGGRDAGHGASRSDSVAAEGWNLSRIQSFT